MTIDALRAGLDVSEVSSTSSTARPDATLRASSTARASSSTSCSPPGRWRANHRGLRLPLVGAVVGLFVPSVAPVAAVGLADDLWSGPERGFRAHLRAGATTGTLKLVGIPLWALWRTRSPRGAVLVALSANVVNQLDTRPGRAIKAFLLGSVALGARPRGASPWPSSSLPTIIAR